MIWKLPFYTQGHNECGPTAVRMVVEFLGAEIPFERIKKEVDSESTGATWSTGLARAAAALGFKVEFFSLHPGFNPEWFKMEWYQKQTDGATAAEEKLRRLQEECLRLGVKVEEKSLSTSEILGKLSDKCAAIVLLDWGKVKKANNYVGHFVPIVGFDEKNVYIHQPGPEDATPNFPIPRQLFDEARKSRGTDEDIVFIAKQNQAP